MNGLSTQQASDFLNQYGLNIISDRKKSNIFIKLFEQFNNFLTILLIIAALISFLIGETIDGALIVAIVFLNGLFGLYQEAKAEQAIEALRKMTIVKVRVLRDGSKQDIDSRYVVPDDIVFVEEGSIIPADSIVVESVNLQVNEAALTGESLPVEKELNSSVFSGTVVVSGRGVLRVVKTGMQTKFGQIAEKLAVIDETETPLQKKLKKLSQVIGFAGIVLAGVVFILSFFTGSGYFPSFLLAVSIAVAVVPEGLPAVMTITLSLGVKEMSKKRVIVRKLSAIETLGAITLLVSDKTGTMTTNKMKVKEIYLEGKLYSSTSLPSLTNRVFSTMLINGILCSTASLVYVHDHNQVDVLGDPTEGSVLYLSQEAGLLPEMVKKEWTMVKEYSFDSVTKRMTVLAQKGKERMVFTKGSPESILEICSTVLEGNKTVPLTGLKRKHIEDQIHAFASHGLRVLGFSFKPALDERTDNASLTSDQTFLGIVAIHDAPRMEVNEAIQKAEEAGIKVVMVTGDNPQTAEAIGVTVGLMREGDEILTGDQLEGYSDEELLALIPRVKIFARTTPFQKHRIVSLYQKMGEIVGVTGDGVNDAIALKQADIGIAMGQMGTDVARESADLVITDDNFATIITAVEEGRNIIKNLRNAVVYLLSCNLAEAVSLVLGLMLGIVNIFYPIQLLYINLVTDGLPALSLAFSPRDEASMRRKPMRELELLGKKQLWFIAITGIFASITVLIGYFVFEPEGLGRAAAFTILTLAQSFVLIELWLSHQSIRKHLHRLFTPFFIVVFSIPFLLQFLIVRIDFLAGLLKVKTVSIGAYFSFAVFAFFILVGIKSAKKLFRDSFS